MRFSTWLPIVVLVALYGAFLIGTIAWMRWRRKTKWPFKESEKLLRTPGETLKRRVIELDEEFALEFAGGIVAVLLVCGVVLLCVSHFALSGVPAMLALVGAFTVSASVSVWRIIRLWRERSNKFIGWFGERVVADKLRPLQFAGYRVFHDLPCEPGEKGFNLDHVIIGPTGVAIVEVKTRRKYKGANGHEVKFDGTKLIWPWGEDQRSVEQTRNEAEWLEKWMADKAGVRTIVKPLLTIPGWYVKESPSSSLRVVATHFLCDAIRGRGEVVLSAVQIDLISRWLDERCRDVTE